MRKIIILVLILAATSAHAGWKMYAPGQKDPIVSSVDDPNAPQKPLVEVIEQPSSTYSTGQARQVEPEDNFDLSGIEWRRTRGLYSGRGAEEMTKKFGYRAGTYRLEYEYKAKGHFAIWMYTRRGMSELLVNRIGKADTQTTVALPKDDEVWFEIHSSTGNWQFTFEKIR
jgi:hypothetical protein